MFVKTSLWKYRILYPSILPVTENHKKPTVWRAITEIGKIQGNFLFTLFSYSALPLWEREEKSVLIGWEVFWGVLWLVGAASRPIFSCSVYMTNCLSLQFCCIATCYDTVFVIWIKLKILFSFIYNYTMCQNLFIHVTQATWLNLISIPTSISEIRYSKNSSYIYTSWWSNQQIIYNKLHKIVGILNCELINQWYFS